VARIRQGSERGDQGGTQEENEPPQTEQQLWLWSRQRTKTHSIVYDIPCHDVKLMAIRSPFVVDAGEEKESLVYGCPPPFRPVVLLQREVEER